MRITFISLAALLGVALGAIFALPRITKDFARVEFPASSVSVAAELATDPESQRIGLSGRDAIGEKNGMLFLFDHPDRYGIWMKGMKFPIDIFWIRNGIVADVEEQAPAPPLASQDASLPVYRPDVPADMVLEVRSGFARAYHIRIGDAVNIVFKGAVLAQGNNAAHSIPASVPSSPREEYFIEHSRASPPRGDHFTVVRTLERNAAYQKSSIMYTVGVRTFTGIMNVPTGPVPVGGFPVLILNHGLIVPKIYFSGRGSKREQDFFTSHGYITIHPDYRGYSSTSPEFPLHHDFYQGYTEDVLALVDALKRAGSPLTDMSRVGMWGHSMGGGIAARAAVLSSDIRAYVLFAPISADVEDNFYELTPEEISFLHDTYGPSGDPVYRKMSPLTYFSDVAAPVQIHHGTADEAVPISFSEKMFAALRQQGKKVEYFTYPGERHEFGVAWQLAASRALQFFDKYVKGAR